MGLLSDAIDRIGLPCVVKPARSGSALGVTVVERSADLAGAVMTALSFSGAVLIEHRIIGTEVAVAGLGTPLATLPAVEIVVGLVPTYVSMLVVLPLAGACALTFTTSSQSSRRLLMLPVPPAATRAPPLCAPVPARHRRPRSPPDAPSVDGASPVDRPEMSDPHRREFLTATAGIAALATLSGSQQAAAGDPSFMNNVPDPALAQKELPTFKFALEQSTGKVIGGSFGKEATVTQLPTPRVLPASR